MRGTDEGAGGAAAGADQQESSDQQDRGCRVEKRVERGEIFNHKRAFASAMRRSMASGSEVR